MIACGVKKERLSKLDIQGHRGARGLVPENTIPAFLLATEMGVTTLELDIVVSQDSQLVVSHEPYFSPVFCLDTLGQKLPPDSIINMYQLPYNDVAKFDCGSTPNPRFPEQKLMPVSKPLLSHVIDSVELLIQRQKLPQIRYNIELKTKKETDNIFHPAPKVFSDLVYQFIIEKKIQNQVTIQSFDFRTLQYFNVTYPDIELAILIENDLDWKINIDSLGFTPEIYSGYYKLLSKELVKDIKTSGMRVIPWTVNEFSDLDEVISWDVDGIITDYPDRALTINKQ